MYYPDFKHIVVLTGTGISAEFYASNLKDSHKMWNKSEVEDLTDPTCFVRTPEKTHTYYNQRRLDLKQVQFNQAHAHIQHMQRELCGSPTKLTIATLNEDDLHEKANTSGVLHINGELNKSLCIKCQYRSDCSSDITIETACGKCLTIGSLRPDIIWKGEKPYHIDKIQSALSECDLFLSVGTVGDEYPTIEFIKTATKAGAHLVELNSTPSKNAVSFDDTRYGNLVDIVPFWIDNFLYDSFS
ncbi:Sir2 family NAD-dependent protein deacetylase [Hirschia litorea]|uniref:protein acetyllysine N-acetyltransferase n=1 Tax=Hirschia litorea TaxID=1199156 RepID=A0ABW2IMZ6_9PROT